MGIGVILPAGGKGSRFGGPIPKQFLEVRSGRPLLQYSLEAFHTLEEVESIVLVLPPDQVEIRRPLVQVFPKLHLAVGGMERWNSVQNGFRALPEHCDPILIHDTARPFIPQSVIRRCVQKLKAGTGVTAAVPATDTIKEVEGEKVKHTLERSRLIQTQTPQGFPRSMLNALYAREFPHNFHPNDEAHIAEELSFPMVWVKGHAIIRKITDPEDWEWAVWMAERLELGEITLHD